MGESQSACTCFSSPWSAIRIIALLSEPYGGQMLRASAGDGAPAASGDGGDCGISSGCPPKKKAVRLFQVKHRVLAPSRAWRQAPPHQDISVPARLSREVRPSDKAGFSPPPPPQQNSSQGWRRPGTLANNLPARYAVNANDSSRARYATKETPIKSGPGRHNLLRMGWLKERRWAGRNLESPRSEASRSRFDPRWCRWW